MGFGVDGVSNSFPQPQNRIRAAAGQESGGAQMTGDSLSLSKPNNVQEEIKAMTPAQGESARKWGGIMAGVGVLGVGAAYWLAPLIVSATGIAAAPALLGVGAVALALFGAVKFAKGLGQAINSVTESKTKQLDDILGKQ